MADDTQLAEATQPLSFAEFLERMKEPAAADLVRSIKKYGSMTWYMVCACDLMCCSIQGFLSADRCFLQLHKDL